MTVTLDKGYYRKVDQGEYRYFFNDQPIKEKCVIAMSRAVEVQEFYDGMKGKKREKYNYKRRERRRIKMLLKIEGKYVDKGSLLARVSEKEAEETEDKKLGRKKIYS